MEPIRQHIAVRAAIVHEGKLLIIRESVKYEGGNQHGLYDLPGGKIHLGESIADALMREVHEEAGIDVTIGKPIHVGEWRPVVRGEALQIFGIFFLCTPENTEVHLSQDHDDFQWVGREDIANYPLTGGLSSVIETLIGEDVLA